MFTIPTFHLFDRRRQTFWSAFILVATVILTLLYVFVLFPQQESFVFSAKNIKISILFNFSALALAVAFMIYLGNLVSSAYDEVKRTNETIESNTKEKEEFFATVSHEIRNPLQSLQGSVELLSELNKANSGQLTQDLPPLLEICKSCCGIVINLVSNILDMSKIAADKMQLSPVPTDLREVVNRVLRTSRGRAEGKSVSLELECDPDLPPAVELDPQRIEQVLVNLISNAVKFTPAKGRVVVKLSWLDPSHGDIQSAISHSGWKQVMELSEESKCSPPTAVRPPLIEDLNRSQIAIPSLRTSVGFRDRCGLRSETLAVNQTESVNIAAGNEGENARPRVTHGIVKLEIMDNGIGISREGTEKLFRPYQQANASISRQGLDYI